MNKSKMPFGLLFEEKDMQTQDYSPPPKFNYNPELQMTDISKQIMAGTSCMGSTTTCTDKNGKPVGGDDDACSDD